MKIKRHFFTIFFSYLLIFSLTLPNVEAKDEIYDLTLMKENHLQPGLGTKYHSIERLINDLMKKHQVNEKQIGLAYYNFSSGEHFYINENHYFIAASTTKVPVAMAYFDLIDQNKITLNQNIPFQNSYYEEGAGYITNSPIKKSYPLKDLIYNMIVYSDNTAWFGLKQNYKKYGDLNNDILTILEINEVPEYYNSDNYSCAYLAEKWLLHIASNEKYYKLIEFMSETEPDQLFTSYIKSGMANKFGRLDNLVHDTGIYYENNQPQYALVCYTEGLKTSDVFLEELNLRVNEFYRNMYLESNHNKLDPNKNKGIKISSK